MIEWSHEVIAGELLCPGVDVTIPGASKVIEAGEAVVRLALVYDRVWHGQNKSVIHVKP